MTTLLLATSFDPVALLSQPAVRWTLTFVYAAVLILVAIYGLHRYWLVLLFLRSRRSIPRPQRRFTELPLITVQLPMFNEAAVAQRVIDAACRLDYPRHLLQIQVLDDSTDDSARIARQTVEHWVSRGVNIEYVHRVRRTGYKAGALAQAMPQVQGELIAIFDADFVPNPSFLRRTVHYFTDPTVGMVQARWSHLNRDESMLTKAQAIFLDGHFLVEHTSRNRTERWINFNGTAGVWRKQAIDEAGGWHADTLTEDVDLSYRAQMAGWKFIYLPRLACPAELPPEINAFKSQQHRWTKGSIQTARKLLPTLLRADLPARVKIEAFFHLTSPMVYLYVTVMALLFYPTMLVNLQPFERGTASNLLWALTIFTLGTASAGAYYVASQRAQHRSVFFTLLQMPLLMSVGIGVALNNARGVVEALLGHESPFVRTPKYNTTISSTNNAQSTVASQPTHRPLIPTPSIKLWMSTLELLMAAYMIECCRLSLLTGATALSFPFLALFAAGYLYVGTASLWSQWLSWRAARQAVQLQLG